LRTRKAAGIVLVVLVVVFGVGLMASANHPATSDAGVDVAWINDMNQETYWENLWDASCTKYEGHNGFIPAQYDAAVIKSGSTQVHVYADLTNTGAFQAIGPPNPNQQHPNRRFEAPFSWVMKCTFNPTTTTIGEPTTTTTKVEETTTTVDATTTTSLTSSTQPSTTITTTGDSPTTTTASPPVTVPSAPSEPELPYTGAGAITGLILAGSALLAGGVAVVRKMTGRG
jgi:hypothetical protein